MALGSGDIGNEVTFLMEPNTLETYPISMPVYKKGCEGELFNM